MSGIITTAGDVTAASLVTALAAATDEQAADMLGALGAATAGKRSVVVSVTSAAALTNHQVPIGLTAGDIDFSATDGTDFFLTDTDGLALPLYVESFDADSETATLWTKIPSLAIGSKSLTLSYGPGGASMLSSGDDVFDFFDDFSSPVTGWEKYSGNPIMVADGTEGGILVRDCAVLYDGPTDYKMWYWGNAGIYYAASLDGITWTKAGQVIATYGRPTVARKDGTYYVFVNDETNIRLYTTTSPTGSYTNVGVVMTPTLAFEDGEIKSPWVIWDAEENIFKMWYSADSYIAASGFPEPKTIGYATSSDGVTWTKNATAILTAPLDESWKDSAMQALHPTKYKGRYYAMLSAASWNGSCRIGIIESADGITWDLSTAKLALDLGNPGSWDSEDNYTGTLLNIRGVWIMWYNSRNVSNVESIGMATLKDNLWQVDTEKWMRHKTVSVSRETSAQVDNSGSGVVTMFAFFTHFKSGNFVAEADFSISSTLISTFTGCGIEFRMNTKSGSSNYSAYSTGFLDGTTLANTRYLSKYISGTETSLSSATQSLNKDAVYRLAVTANGAAITTTLNGVAGANVSDASLTTGSFGIRPFQAQSRLQMFRVRKFAASQPTITVLP